MNKKKEKKYIKLANHLTSCLKRLRRNHRSKNETTFSVLKRVNGSTIRSIKVSMQNKEVLLKEIVYNANRLIGYFIDFLKEVY